MASGSLQRGGSQSSFGLNEVCHQVITDFKGQPVLSLEDAHLPGSTCTKPSVDSGWDGVQEREGNWWWGRGRLQSPWQYLEQRAWDWSAQSPPHLQLSVHLGAELFVAMASELGHLTRSPIRAWPLVQRTLRQGQEAWDRVSSLHFCVFSCGSTPDKFSFPGRTPHPPPTTACNTVTLPQHASSLLPAIIFPEEVLSRLYLYITLSLIVDFHPLGYKPHSGKEGNFRSLMLIPRAQRA